MYRSVILAGLLATLSPTGAAEAAARISWSLESAGPHHDGREVQLTVESRWSQTSQSSWSNSHDVSDLGLTAARVMGPRQPVRFVFAREAGALDCSGTLGHGQGEGSCSFSPDVGFSTFLDARRIERPDERQSFSLTMSGVGRELVDALDKGGFQRPSIEQLTALGIHGASAAYVRDLAGSGYRLSADDLIAFRIHGVKADYVRELGSISPALRHISPSDLVSLKIHGVKADYVRELAEIGPQLAGITAEDLVSFAIHGVRPEMVRAYVHLSRRPVAAGDIVAMAIHGVTPEFIEALASAGYRDLSANDLVALSIHGVTAAYVRSLQRAGMPVMSADQLVRLRLAGFEGRRN